MKIDYKLASFEDIDALVKVGDNLFDHQVIIETAEEFFADPRHHLIIALCQSEVIGMASAFHYVHPDKNSQLFINEVGVVDEFQGKGIGTELVIKMKEHGKILGCEEAWIATEEPNKAACRAYEKAGGRRDPDQIVLFEFQLND